MNSVNIYINSCNEKALNGWCVKLISGNLFKNLKGGERDTDSTNVDLKTVLVGLKALKNVKDSKVSLYISGSAYTILNNINKHKNNGFKNVKKYEKLLDNISTLLKIYNVKVYRFDVKNFLYKETKDMAKQGVIMLKNSKSNSVNNLELEQKIATQIVNSLNAIIYADKDILIKIRNKNQDMFNKTIEYLQEINKE